jgi:hypothetical protein
VATSTRANAPTTPAIIRAFMKLFQPTKRTNIVFSSGTLCVSIPPRRSWAWLSIEIVALAAIVITAYVLWPITSSLLHALFVGVIVTDCLSALYRLSVTQSIQFDSLYIAKCKDFRGWERRSRYKVEDCAELEWSTGTEHSPAGLNCKVRLRTIKLFEDLSETESIEILTALQKYLPEVAQKVCSYPQSREHFLSLNIGGQK